MASTAARSTYARSWLFCARNDDGERVWPKERAISARVPAEFGPPARARSLLFSYAR